MEVQPTINKNSGLKHSFIISLLETPCATRSDGGNSCLKNKNPYTSVGGIMMIICHFQPAMKFKTRYATLGFSDKAKLDDGAMWPNSFALAKLTPEVEARITALVKQAVG